MAGGIFVTGTDTGVGKTAVACALLHAARARGLPAAGFKPVASGSRDTPGGPRNADGEALLALSAPGLAYAEVNPYALPEPVAPHLAARRAGVALERDVLLAAFRRLRDRGLWVVTEGVGGWRVPLGRNWDTADLARALGLPVLLVVGLRLGCLNHALLTAESVAAAGLSLAGWVAVPLDPGMALAAENAAALEERLPAPCLGRLPFLRPPRPAAVARHLQTQTIFI